jgi:hypothetical protein
MGYGWVLRIETNSAKLDWPTIFVAKMGKNYLPFLIVHSTFGMK